MADPVSTVGSSGRILPIASQSPRIHGTKAPVSDSDPASREDLFQKALEADRTQGSSKVQDPVSDPLQEAVKEVEAHLSTLSDNLQFGVDKDTNILTLKVVDSSTGKVLREYPPEEVLKMAKYIRESMKSQDTGLLVDVQH